MGGGGGGGGGVGDGECIELANGLRVEDLAVCFFCGRWSGGGKIFIDQQEWRIQESEEGGLPHPFPESHTTFS